MYTAAPTDHPRAAAFVHRRLKSACVSQFTSKDLATVAIHLKNNKTLYVASLYCHGDDRPPGNPIKTLVQHCNDHQIPLLIGADSNSHSSFWGNDTPDDRGEAFEDFILGYELDLLNDTKRPT